MKNLSIKKLKLIRLLSTIAFIIVGFILPLFIICDKLKLFTEITAVKVSWLSIIFLITLAYTFKSAIMEYINSLEYSIFKTIVLGLSKVGFLVIVLTLEVVLSIVLTNIGQETLAKLLSTLDTIRYIIRWWCILNITAHLAIKPVMDSCTHYIAKEARKEEFREVLKE